MPLPSLTAAEAEPVAVFTDNHPRVYLDLTEEQSRTLAIAKPVLDFARCFEAMTGHELPRTGGKPRLFDPTQPWPTRFECRVTGMRDGKRDYGQQIEVRCWDSVDARAATPTRLSFELLEKVAAEIIQEVPGIVSVTYNIAPKPPSTIEAV